MSLIDKETVESIYTFVLADDDVKSIRARTKKDVPLSTRCPGYDNGYAENGTDNGQEIWLDITYLNNSLLKHCCIVNEYCITNINEKVVKIQNITLDESVRGKGILKRINSRQMKVYKDKLFKRMVLTATNSGLVVWHRLGFRYTQKRDELKVLKHLNDYIRDIKGEDTKYKAILLVPPELMIDDDENFTDYLIRKDVNYLKMAMEL